MINLLYEKYPTEVIVNSQSYPIYTDFRDWIAFFDMRDNTSISKEDAMLTKKQLKEKKHLMI